MRSINPMTFEDYEKSLTVPGNDKPVVKNRETDEATEVNATTLSPFVPGKNAAISTETRTRALGYAHPIDSGIVKALDTPAVNAILSKIVQTNIDANYGLTLATGIHVTPKTSPELYEIVEACARELGMAIPYVIVSNSMRGLNACTCGTNQFSFIMISSLLPMVMKKEELCFVIGHEMGHLAMGHALYHTAAQILGSATGFIPVVGSYVSAAVTYPINAWNRRSEITADRAGLICCKDLEVAKKSLFRLEAGLYSAKGVDIDEYVEESERMLANSHLGKLTEFKYSHPIIPKRIRALELFAGSEVYAETMGYQKTYDMISREELNKETERIIEIMDNPVKS